MTEPIPTDVMSLLRAHRDAIDATDDELLALLRKRADLARAIGELKRSSALAMHAPERERWVMQRLAAKADDGLPREAIVAVFREVMSACLRLEEPIRVACLGPGSTFSFLALQKVFGVGAVAVSEPTIDLVFDAAENGRAHYAIVPMENSSEGGVNATLQRLLSTGLVISSQCYLRVEQNLASLAASLSDVQVVHSHPQALGQTRRWLAEHLPQAALRETRSTSIACQHALEDPTSAAICSTASALENDLPLLARNVHDAVGNETRFLVLARDRMYKQRDDDITSLVFAVNDTAGSLQTALEVFSRHGVNLHKLQSIPDTSKPWSVYFWLDAGLPEHDPRLGAALVELGALSTSLRVLGSYPRVAE